MIRPPIRTATPKDLPEIAQLIRELADYEKLSHEVEFDEAQLGQHLFGPKPYAEVLIAEDDESRGVVGFALFFHNFSTFCGQPGIYLEDLFVRPAYRGKGYGKALLRRLAQLAVERGYARVEWAVLNWNTPAIEFYRSLGAVPMDGWTVNRIDGQTLRDFATEQSH